MFWRLITMQFPRQSSRIQRLEYYDIYLRPVPGKKRSLWLLRNTSLINGHVNALIR